MLTELQIKDRLDNLAWPQVWRQVSHQGLWQIVNEAKPPINQVRNQIEKQARFQVKEGTKCFIY